MNQGIKAKLSILNLSFIIGLVILSIISTSNTMISSYRAVYVKTALGGSATAAGLVGMWWTYGSMIVRIFVGRISAKYGDKRLLTLGSIGYGLTLALAALTTNIPSFTVVIILQAICHPFCYITCNSILAKSVPKGQEGTGTFLFVGIPTAICSAAGPAIANACVQASGFPLMFVVAGLLMAVSVILAIVLIIYSRKTASDPQTEKKVVSETAEVVLDAQGNPYKGIWKYVEKTALGPCFVQILGSLAEMSVMLYGMLYANELGVPACGVILFSAISGAELVVTFILGSVMDRFGLLAVMIPYLVAGIGSYVIFLQGSTSMTVWLITGIMYGIAAGVSRPTYNAGMIKMVPKNRLNIATSNFALATSIGGGLASLFIGMMIDGMGFGGVWVFSIIMFAITFLAAVLVFRRFLTPGKTAAAAAGN